MQNRPQIAIAALSIPQANYSMNQIKLLSEQIIKVCEQFQALHPDCDDWIVTWPEYGVRDEPAKFASKEAKAHLKVVMQALTKRFPKLTVVAPIATKCCSCELKKNPNRLQSIKKYFNEKQEIVRAPLDLVDYDLSYKVDQFTLSEVELYYIVRNTSYVFSSGKCMTRHDKMTPYNKELWDTPIKPPQYNVFFQSGNKKGNQPYFTLPNSQLEVGLEICLEHQKSVLKKIRIKEKKNPLAFHLLMSNSTSVRQENIFGEHFLQVDSKYLPELFTTRPENELSASVFAYESTINQEKNITLEPVSKRKVCSVQVK